MGNLLMRRREMVQVASSPIVCPYITDGLIFWLDGIDRGGVTGEWKDLVGGKIFTLTGCTESANGIYFAGATTSYASYNGAISSNWQNETLEVAVSGQTWKNANLLCPTKANGTVGIAHICASGNANFWINMDGTSAKGFSNAYGRGRASANTSYYVLNGASASSGSSDSWGANTSGTTYIGKRNTNAKPFKGTVHSIRIYNRHLTVAEMQANQAVDVSRFYS